MRMISHAALVLCLLVAAAMFAAAHMHLLPLWVFMTLSALMMFCFGLMFSNFTALALEPQRFNAGTASSLYGSITTLLGIGAGALIGQGYDGTVTPFATGFLACTFISLVIVAITERGRLFRPHQMAAK
jgi:DHA1 family bicyclomycin/chloramphenicol resistance-like MFS transporter